MAASVSQMIQRNISASYCNRNDYLVREYYHACRLPTVLGWACLPMNQFLIKPKHIGDLSYAHTMNGTLYGAIASSSWRKGNAATLGIEITPNTTA